MKKLIKWINSLWMVGMVDEFLHPYRDNKEPINEKSKLN